MFGKRIILSCIYGWDYYYPVIISNRSSEELTIEIQIPLVGSVIVSLMTQN